MIIEQFQGEVLLRGALSKSSWQIEQSNALKHFWTQHFFFLSILHFAKWRYNTMTADMRAFQTQNMPYLGNHNFTRNSLIQSILPEFWI